MGTASAYQNWSKSTPYRMIAEDFPNLIPSLVITNVATGAPPMVEGVMAEAKSHESAIRIEAIRFIALSARNRIFSAEK